MQVVLAFSQSTTGVQRCHPIMCILGAPAGVNIESESINWERSTRVRSSVTVVVIVCAALGAGDRWRGKGTGLLCDDVDASWCRWSYTRFGCLPAERLLCAQRQALPLQQWEACLERPHVFSPSKKASVAWCCCSIPGAGCALVEPNC